MTRTSRLLKSKKAGAYIYLGAVFMIVGFIATLACMHFFEMYVSRTRAQLICDAIADGAAVAGQSNIGFNEDRVVSMAKKIFDYNTPSNAEQEYTLEIVDEIDGAGNPTGNKLIKVYLKATREPILNGGLLKNAYTVHAHATVKAKITYETDYVLSFSYWGDDYNNRTVPFATTTPGTRNPGYVSWLINYYLNPEYSEMYLKSWQDFMNKDVNSYFLFDYLKHMAIDLGSGMRPIHVDYYDTGLNGSLGLQGGLIPGAGATTQDTIRKRIETNGTLPFPGWERVSGAENIQAIANTGRPVILFALEQGGLSGTMTAYVVVPQNGNLPDGCVAVAYASNQGGKSNYEILDTEMIGLGTRAIYAFWHE